MFRFNRRKPVELVMQHPVAEPPASPALVQELHAVDQRLAEWAAYEREVRDRAAIDDLLDERLAVARAMVPVIPGRTS